MDKYKINYSLKVIYIIAIIFILSGCGTGILFKEVNSDEKILVVVMPFKEDNYNCNMDIESILLRKNYDIYNGKLLIDECCLSLKKSVDSISISEFVDFASSRYIDKIIFGIVKYEWLEGVYSKPGIELERDKLVEGNYAILNCDWVDLKTKKVEKIVSNYRIKKVPLGMPDNIYVSPSF